MYDAAIALIAAIVAVVNNWAPSTLGKRIEGMADMLADLLEELNDCLQQALKDKEAWKEDAEDLYSQMEEKRKETKKLENKLFEMENKVKDLNHSLACKEDDRRHLDNSLEKAAKTIKFLELMTMGNMFADSEAFKYAVEAFAFESSKIETIKVVRATMGWDLEQSKAIVESIID